jgi:Spy/CpxP family protein refolding chaperone
MINNRAKLATGRVELSQLLENDNPDMGAVEKRIKANHEIDAEIDLAGIKANKAADAVLTAEQKKAAESLRQPAPRDRMARGMGGRPGRGMRGAQPDRTPQQEKK